MANQINVDLVLKGLQTATTGIKKVQDEVVKIGKAVINNRKSFDTFFKAAKTGYNGLKTSITTLKDSIFNLKTGVIALVGAFSFTKAIQAANKQEDAVNQLNIALRITGKLTQDTSDELQAFASQLQQASKFGDELILQNAALIQSLGNLEKDALKQATQAAVDLSAALGIDLTTAATLVGKAAAGEIGSFSRYGVVIQKGSTNAQTFANTLDVLNSKFGGAAKGQIETFSGATTQLSNTFGDFLEQIGFFVTKNESVIKIVKLLTTGFQALIKVLQDNEKAIINLTTKAIKFLVGGISSIIKGITSLSKKFLNFKADIENVFGSTSLSKIKDLKNEIAELQSNQASLFDSKGLTDEGKRLNRLIDQLQELKKQRKEANIERRESLDFFNEFEKTISEINKKVQSVETAQVKIKIDQSSVEKQAVSFSNSLSDALKTAFKDPFTAIFGDKKLDLSQLTAVGLNFGGSILQGAKGAQKFLTDGISSGLDLIAPGLGQAAKPIIDAFSQGPDSVKALVTDFARSLPEIAKNIILSAPAFIEALIEETPRLIESILEAIPQVVSTLATESVGKIVVKLVENVPKIIDALISQTPRLIGSIIGQLPTLIAKLGQGIIDALKNAGQFLIEQLSDFPRLLGNAAIRAGNFLIDAIKNAFESITGGVGDAVSSIGDFFGFAGGGKIPKGFNNDNFPMRATSGEYVIDRGLTAQLENFFANQQTNDNSVLTNSLLSSILSTLQNGENISTSVEFNQDTLANILVNLNRTGTRIA